MKKYVIHILIVFLLIACSSEESVEKEVNKLELQTNEVTDIKIYSIIVGGKLIDSGNLDIIEIGIVAGQTSMPSLEDNLAKFIGNPDEYGNFSIRVTDIPSNTVYYFRAYAISAEGDKYYGNEVQFTSLDEKVHVGDVILNSQEKVNEFGAKNYTRINGKLKIHGPVTDLSSLESVVILDYSFEVRNTNLTNLEGLNNLKVIGNNSPLGMNIISNRLLENLSGLNNLEIVRGNTHIFENDNLINLKGLNSLIAASVGDIRIEGCEALTSLSGLENLVFIGADFYLRDNPNLIDISSISKLEFIKFQLHIDNNDSLKNLDGFEGLTTVESVIIQRNQELINLNGLNNLVSAPRGVIIKYNEKLKSINTFNKITSMKDLFIENNDALTSLSAFNNLTSIDKSLKVINNPNLTSLTGLEKLNSLQQVYIYSNNSLTNLSGLNGLSKTTDEGSGVYIRNNLNLNSLIGLENLMEMKGSIRIVDNPLLNDYCPLKNLLLNGVLVGSTIFENNLKNPTVDEIINNCN